MENYVELDATVSIRLMMRDGESEEEANNRLYDILYDGLCYLTDHTVDFWIEHTRAVE